MKTQISIYYPQWLQLLELLDIALRGVATLIYESDTGVYIYIPYKNSADLEEAL